MNSSLWGFLIMDAAYLISKILPDIFAARKHALN